MMHSLVEAMNYRAEKRRELETLRQELEGLLQKVDLPGKHRGPDELAVRLGNGELIRAVLAEADELAYLAGNMADLRDALKEYLSGE